MEKLNKFNNVFQWVEIITMIAAFISNTILFVSSMAFNYWGKWLVYVVSAVMALCAVWVLMFILLRICEWIYDRKVSAEYEADEEYEDD